MWDWQLSAKYSIIHTEYEEEFSELLVPHNIVMNLNNIMSIIWHTVGY